MDHHFKEVVSLSSELRYIQNAKEEFYRAYGNLFLKAASNDFRDERLKKMVKGLKLQQYAQEYKALLEQAEQNTKRLGHIFLDDTREIKAFEQKNRSKLNQIRSCGRCQCIDCIVACCEFSSCGNCRTNSHVSCCDRRETCQRMVEDTLVLYHETLAEDVEFNILGIIELKDGRAYILLEERENEDNKQIFRIQESVEGVSYEAIEDEKELEHVANIYMER